MSDIINHFDTISLAKLLKSSLVFLELCPSFLLRFNVSRHFLNDDPHIVTGIWFEVIVEIDRDAVKALSVD